MEQEANLDGQAVIRTQLEQLLMGSNAHADFEKAIEGVSVSDRGNKPMGASHTAWQLLEHMRRAQHDILAFSRNGRYKSPKWPDEYWPETEVPPNEQAWDVSVSSYLRDRKEFLDLIEDRNCDLFAPIPHAPNGQTLFRQALVLADHNSYHTGQIVLLRKIIDSWER